MSGSVPEGSVRNTHMEGRSQVGSRRLENLRSGPFFRVVRLRPRLFRPCTAKFAVSGRSDLLDDDLSDRLC
jgi:hypothetical protein